MTLLEFTVFGVAQPKGSTKAFLPKGWTRPIVTSDNAKNKSWQELVAFGANAALQDCADFPPAPLEGPVHLRVNFYLPRPKSLPKKVTVHLKKPDLDKLVRSVKDALSRVVWRDDSQVIELMATKSYAVDDVPRVRITVVPIADRLPLETERTPA